MKYSLSWRVLSIPEAIGTPKNLWTCSCQWRTNPQILLGPLFPFVEKSVLEEIVFKKPPQELWDASSCKTSNKSFAGYFTYLHNSQKIRCTNLFLQLGTLVGKERGCESSGSSLYWQWGERLDGVRRSPLETRAEGTDIFYGRKPLPLEVQGMGEGSPTLRGSHTRAPGPLGV